MMTDSDHRVDLECLTWSCRTGRSLLCDRYSTGLRSPDLAENTGHTGHPHLLSESRIAVKTASRFDYAQLRRRHRMCTLCHDLRPPEIRVTTSHYLLTGAASTVPGRARKDAPFDPLLATKLVIRAVIATVLATASAPDQFACDTLRT